MKNLQEDVPQGGQFLDGIEYPQIYYFFRNNFGIQLQENEIEEIQLSLFHYGKALALFMEQKGYERSTK